MEDFTAAVPVVLQYATVHGAKRHDKGGRAVLWKQGDRRYLLTVERLATYADIKSGETLQAVVMPQLRPSRDGPKLMYTNIAKEAIPTWSRAPYPSDDDEDESILLLDGDKKLDLRQTDHVYYLDVTERAWSEAPQLSPLSESSMQLSLGERLRFAPQRRLGTGFLAEYPQWRPVQELDMMSKESRYPGAANEYYSVGAAAQVPPLNVTNCKGAQVAFTFPSQVLNDFCYRPPAFLIDVNVKGSSTGWPLINEDGELVGLVSAPYYPTLSQDKCWPGTWVVAIPAGLTLPEPVVEVVEETEKKQQPKKKTNAAKKKKKAKGKKRK